MPSNAPRPCVCATGDIRYFRAGRCQACEGHGIRNQSREKVLDHNRVVRRPTLDEYLAFDGAHCKNIYRSLPEHWLCPGCLRTKCQVLRWTTLFPKNPAARSPGWAGGYHSHHDHTGDKYLWSGTPSSFTPRFEPTVICEQCNSADAAAKRKLKLPSEFSFSPLEIKQFVTTYPHGKHLINYRVALSIYAGLGGLP